MDIANIIESYQAMQATAERLAKANHEAIAWAEGQNNRAFIMDDDIRLDVDYSTPDDHVRCSGMVYPTGETFDFTVPASLFAAVLTSV